MLTRISWLTFFLVNACTVDPVEPAETEEPPVVEAPTVEPAAAEPPAGATSLESATKNRQLRTADQLAQALRDVARILQEMKEAAQEAAARPGSQCEKAEASVRAAVTVSERAARDLGRVAPEWVIAPREDYMRRCNALPEAAQRCARFDYRGEHDDECEQALAALSEDQRASYEAMFHRAPRE
ncbi:MAG: hypothetical protein AAGE52_11265 [Myxococcota bacterium]